MSLIEDLNWRYATKKMNGETVSQEKVDYILEAAWLAPASSGLQPFEIFEKALCTYFLVVFATLLIKNMFFLFI